MLATLPFSRKVISPAIILTSSHPCLLTSNGGLSWRISANILRFDGDLLYLNEAPPASSTLQFSRRILSPVILIFGHPYSSSSLLASGKRNSANNLCFRVKPPRKNAGTLQPVANPGKCRRDQCCVDRLGVCPPSDRDDVPAFRQRFNKPNLLSTRVNENLVTVDGKSDVPLAVLPFFLSHNVSGRSSSSKFTDFKELKSVWSILGCRTVWRELQLEDHYSIRQSSVLRDAAMRTQQRSAGSNIHAEQVGYEGYHARTTQQRPT